MFDDILQSDVGDIADDIGGPLSKEEGYAFLIKTPAPVAIPSTTYPQNRKVYKGRYPEELWSTQHDLIAYANRS
ncbi:hypothetical protein RBI80_29295 (plasmid) [Klebsiella variicola]|nr:hypothetical protein RBI80_29295 [Klebsiella variicola]